MFAVGIALPINHTNSTSLSLSKTNKFNQDFLYDINNKMDSQNSLSKYLSSPLFNRKVFLTNRTIIPTPYSLKQDSDESSYSISVQYVRAYQNQITSLYMLIVFFILDLTLFECYKYDSQN